MVVSFMSRNPCIRRAVALLALAAAAFRRLPWHRSHTERILLPLISDFAYDFYVILKALKIMDRSQRGLSAEPLRLRRVPDLLSADLQLVYQESQIGYQISHGDLWALKTLNSQRRIPEKIIHACSSSSVDAEATVRPLDRRT